MIRWRHWGFLAALCAVRRQLGATALARGYRPRRGFPPAAAVCGAALVVAAGFFLPSISARLCFSAAIRSTTGASFFGLSISTTLPPSSLVSISFFRFSWNVVVIFFRIPVSGQGFDQLVRDFHFGVFQFHVGCAEAFHLPDFFGVVHGVQHHSACVGTQEDGVLAVVHGEFRDGDVLALFKALVSSA